MISSLFQKILPEGPTCRKRQTATSEAAVMTFDRETATPLCHNGRGCMQ